MFVAFQCSRRRLLILLSGAAQPVASVMKTGDQAYTRTFENNIRKAFKTCGFSTGPERYEFQSSITASLRKHLHAVMWTDHAGRPHEVIHKLAHSETMDEDKQVHLSLIHI